MVKSIKGADVACKAFVCSKLSFSGGMDFAESKTIFFVCLWRFFSCT